MFILVSACLLGLPAKYNGEKKRYAQVEALFRDPRFQAVPFCPECEGGLPVPRPPAERRGEKVADRNGRDVTKEFRTGAERAVRRAIDTGCAAALLKARSPSCGSGRIYDGSFSGVLIPGDGLTAEYLKKAGIPVYDETEIEKMKEEILCGK